MISGAKYSGVPHIEWALEFSNVIFDNPKSANFKYPLSSTKIFSGLLWNK